MPSREGAVPQEYTECAYGCFTPRQDLEGCVIFFYGTTGDHCMPIGVSHITIYIHEPDFLGGIWFLAAQQAITEYLARPDPCPTLAVFALGQLAEMSQKKK
ncbi:MAG: hypothetical protein Q8P73_03375 [bacterium]|nr:hypothetical protein [bacterium]